MARKNLDDICIQPSKRARGYTINEGVTAPSKIGTQAPKKGGKGKASEKEIRSKTPAMMRNLFILKDRV